MRLHGYTVTRLVLSNVDACVGNADGQNINIKIHRMVNFTLIPHLRVICVEKRKIWRCFPMLMHAVAMPTALYQYQNSPHGEFYLNTAFASDLRRKTQILERFSYVDACGGNADGWGEQAGAVALTVGLTFWILF